MAAKWAGAWLAIMIAGQMDIPVGTVATNPVVPNGEGVLSGLNATTGAIL